MKNLSSGFKLPVNGEDIKYGDIIKSKNTHDFIVMYDNKNDLPIVKLVDENIIFRLE